MSLVKNALGAQAACLFAFLITTKDAGGDACAPRAPL
jgi:hypothetical protein